MLDTILQLRFSCRGRFSMRTLVFSFPFCSGIIQSTIWPYIDVRGHSGERLVDWLILDVFLSSKYNELSTSQLSRLADWVGSSAREREREREIWQRFSSENKSWKKRTLFSVVFLFPDFSVKTEMKKQQQKNRNQFSYLSICRRKTETKILPF